MPLSPRAPALLALLLAGCAPAPSERAGRPEPALRWYRELAIEAAGGDAPAMLGEPGGGLWVAVTGVSSAAGKSRLLYRSPEGVWETRHQGPFATEPSLSAARAGEVFYGHNLPLQGFRPELLAVSAAGVRALDPPLQRIDALEYLQMGGYALLSDQEGFACGQRGSLFRLSAGRWSALPPVLPWKPGDPANAAFCEGIHLTAPDRGALADVEGNAAIWDGVSWRAVPRVGPARFLGPSGLAQDGRSLLSPDARALVPFAGQLPASSRLVLDAEARWAAQAEGLSALENKHIRALPGRLPFTPTALAEAGGEVWALAQDGVYRSTRLHLPTFSAAPGALPPGLACALALDLDHDGDEDLLALHPRESERPAGSAPLVALLNDGAGRFHEETLGLPVNVVLFRDHLDAGDVDGDGDLDVVAATTDGRVGLWINAGGRFTLAWSLAASNTAVALVDADGDGDLDLHLTALGLLRNDGAGHFSEGPRLPLPEPPIERATWADVDGDGDADALLQHWRDPAHLLRNTGEGFTLEALPVVAEGAAFRDLDLDGAPELYAQKVHVRGVALPFARCRVTAQGCAPDEGPPVPAGLFTDLDLDGHPEVIADDLRGDEAMTSEGEVYLGPAFTRITEITGALPHPVILDADGDGDPDVYTSPLGLRLNTADPSTFLRVHLEASRSDRLARGAWAVVRRAGGGPIVASGEARFGVLTLGLPDADARYDLDLRFPAGERRTVRDLRAGSELTVRDAEGLAFHARLARLWITGSARRALPLRELGLAAAALALFLALRRRARAPRLRAALPLFAAAWLALAGLLLREGGAAPWLLTPLAATVAALGQGALLLRARRRALRRAGPYLLEERLGQGAAATVWRARAGREIVALKLFEAEAMAAGDARERFFREARIGSEIRHPAVVRIHDAGELADGRCFLAMELIAGRSLEAELRLDGKLGPARAVAIARDLARGLGALHGAGVVHRDLKPANVMLRPDGSAVLTDLGLARSALFKTLTRHDVAVGTLAYMSPEQCVGRPLDGRSDLWSLGVVLHEALTGKRPFQAEHELELVYVIHNVDPPRPSSLAPAVPSTLDDIVLRCLAREPDERFASADELAAALESALPAGA
jgi:tRNA A-37 threonylcarbamoyl transferase component Bud32